MPYTKENVSHLTLRDIADFSVNLFKHAHTPSKNTLVSPTSLLAVLMMLQQGAREFTQMELDAVTGLQTEESVGLLNTMLSDEPVGEECFESLIYEANRAVRSANAMWLKDDGTVTFDPAYINKCRERFNTEVFLGLLSDQTCREINRWAKEKTDGEVSDMIGSLPPESAMLLVNALVFDAKWESPYDSSDVRKHEFTTGDGTVQTGDFMSSEERVFLLDDNARGFAKAYMNNRYEFVALLPDVGVSLREYISGLTGERLLSIISNPIRRDVDALLPKFDATSDLDLKGTLKQMGVTTAFEEDFADFSGIGTPADPDYNLCIGDILQQNRIRVNESGTKAVALTIAMATNCLCSCIKPRPYKVHLDRPFLYMILDRKTDLPLFMGTVENLAEQRADR